MCGEYDARIHNASAPLDTTIVCDAIIKSGASGKWQTLALGA